MAANVEWNANWEWQVGAGMQRLILVRKGSRDEADIFCMPFFLINVPPEAASLHRLVRSQAGVSFFLYRRLIGHTAPALTRQGPAGPAGPALAPLAKQQGHMEPINSQEALDLEHLSLATTYRRRIEDVSKTLSKTLSTTLSTTHRAYGTNAHALSRWCSSR